LRHPVSTLLIYFGPPCIDWTTSFHLENKKQELKTKQHTLEMLQQLSCVTKVQNHANAVYLLITTAENKT